MPLKFVFYFLLPYKISCFSTRLEPTPSSGTGLAWSGTGLAWLGLVWIECAESHGPRRGLGKQEPDYTAHMYPTAI